MYGTIQGVLGLYQSIDEARTWKRIDDAGHRFGALANGGFLRGYANTFGVVYRSTAGRGIAARLPSHRTGIGEGPRRQARAGYPWSLEGSPVRLRVGAGATGTAIVAELLDLRGVEWRGARCRRGNLRPPGSGCHGRGPIFCGSRSPRRGGAGRWRCLSWIRPGTVAPSCSRSRTVSSE